MSNEVVMTSKSNKKRISKRRSSLRRNKRITSSVKSKAIVPVMNTKKFPTIKSPAKNKKNIIILDLDSTLVHSLDDKERKRFKGDLTKYSSTDTEEFLVIHRPNVQLFLDFLFDNFKVGVWSAGDKEYVHMVVKHVISCKPKRKLQFILSFDECTQSQDYYGNLKDLRLLWHKLGHKYCNINNTLIIDDYNKVVAHQKCNAIHVAKFNVLKDTNSHEDKELKSVIKHLKSYKSCDVVRDIHIY